MKKLLKLDLILLILLAILVYAPIFSSWFFMDDFYFLQISKAANLREFFLFFKPILGIPFRPVSQQIFFFTFQRIFGLRVLPFFIFTFLIHILSAWLVYKIGRCFVKERIKAKLISLMYVISPIFYMGLYSLTGSYVLFGILYFLLSFWLWLRFENEKRNWLYFLSLLFFILAIFSSEIAFSLPILIFLFSKYKNKLKRITPYGIIIVSNLLINYFFAGAPETQAFSFKFSSFPSVFRWYILRAFGLPEGVKNGYLWETRLIYALFFILLTLLTAGLYKWYQAKKEIFKKELKLILKYLLWIFVSALPFYFMPYHLNPIYFSISFIGFLFLLEKILDKKFFYFYLFISIIISFFSVRLLAHTHWTARRASLAKDWITRTRTNCSYYNSNNKVDILMEEEGLAEELMITLQKDRALQLFCQNEDLKVIYKVYGENKSLIE
ncbi:hypothetical protein COT75_01660 [Candidatus Beckwithbacteria bacterium CG10_big_fil_rev_8_21_14_0_10_34_10]|uniref:Glycosyltransferase RgtA/B/C/D-like domain-containing protein n=1 Tax=Candidatus Beckwithbacteria bacterium CG10_big_fil_rev_8_21_14_0_10_34_10 TaxID=1974495 RepID=A0A2H0W9M1_9BACT|nr:MAG: hypothetical protein COT75_01660 [Candidatus Beckwithbacteria bacterium CG10_big_fil_rev_8_21_14_0_10_34_10]